MPKIKKTSKQDRHVPYARGFKPSSQKQQLQAIGFGGGSSTLPVFYRDNEQDSTNNKDGDGSQLQFFQPIPPPTCVDDWLAQFVEEGQSFRQYLDENPWFSKRKHKFLRQEFVPSGGTISEKYPNGKIYIAKLGDFCAVPFEDLVDYASRFLCLPVEQFGCLEVKREGNDLKFIKQPGVKTEGGRSTARITKSLLETRHNAKRNHLQIRVDSLLHKLRHSIPDDALCLIALTEYDLYGDDPDLFVAGMASGNQRVAVFSLYRYDPALQFSTEFWYDIVNKKVACQAERCRLMLQRSCKLVVHEICHLLGVAHCVYYNCCMNGSGHLEEDFRQPMMLCPVDLHKLQALIGFDVKDRYLSLLAFYKEKGLIEEAEWTEKRIQFISQPQLTT